MIGAMLDAISHCSEHPAEAVGKTVRPYRTPQVTERSHQFLLMLKPELTRAALAADEPSFDFDEADDELGELIAIVSAARLVLAGASL